MSTATQTQARPTSSGSGGGQGQGHAVTANKALKRACDCCRKRKVKCDGADPCSPCKKASIQCAYLQPPKKKGPKGLRSPGVLHALRRINDTVAEGPSSTSMSPEQQNNPHFAGWGWGTQQQQPHSPTALQHHEQSIPPPTSLPYDAQSEYSQRPELAQANSLSQVPQQQQQQQHYTQSIYRQDAGWSPSDTLSAGSEGHPAVTSPAQSEHYQRSLRLPSDSLPPYVQLFFTHMFPIMPIIDGSQYLDPNLYTNIASMNPDLYCFLCALCATTIVQLDASIPTPPPLRPGRATDDVFADEVTRERKHYDYVANTSTLSVMTSFFLFCYHGNHEHYEHAWFFLQESITFAENLCLDDEEAYAKLDPVEAQWRRRLYWLLFITERAYAVQRRKKTRLTSSVILPAVFESEDPQLLNGFVNLANLFSAVDDNFVSAWRGARRSSLVTETWLAKTQKSLDQTAINMESMTETQHVDISITREWLHVLAWQMGVSNGLMWGEGEGGMRLDYPIEIAEKVVRITTSADRQVLDSHGIGMEQKISDIAGCLADVLRCTSGDTSATFAEGKHYLQILLQQLSAIRGKESRYLRPLMLKMEDLMTFDASTNTNANANAMQQPQPDVRISEPAGTTSMLASPDTEMTNGGSNGGFSMSRGLSVSQGSVEMLRSMSMSGSLGMPVLQADMWERRPSGRFLSEEGVNWFMGAA